MNLFDLFQRKDPNLVASDGTAPGKLALGPAQWRGLLLPPGGRLRIRGAPRWFPLRERPATAGWHATSLRGRAAVGLAFTAPDGAPLGPELEVELDQQPRALPLPWPDRPARLPEDAELAIRDPGAAAAGLFVAVHRVLDRAPLLALARGRGVEIGPGPKPQVLPGPDVDVIYVEQRMADEWQQLYNARGRFDVDPALWQRYRIGDAHDLPVPDASLDFVFSSHVFEHLANPLEHLRRWRQKLRAGGRVLAVVPDLTCAKEYMFAPTPLAELLAEYARGGIAPELHHYETWVRARGVRRGAAELYAERFSIHVHHYTRRNVTELLEWAVAELGFRGYELEHEPNHKDFHFVLRA